MRLLAVYLTLLLSCPAVFCFSIDVQVLPSVITSETDVTVLVTVSSATAPRRYQPTQVIRDGDNVLIIIYPDYGVVGIAGSFDELISLGRLNATETKLTVVLVSSTIENEGRRIYTTSLNVVPKLGNFPIIVREPHFQKVRAGDQVTLSTIAGGGVTSHYQWYQGESGDMSTPISGATNATFTTPPLSTNGNFWVKILTAAGSTNSMTAALAVFPGNSVLLNLKMNAGIPSLTIDGPTELPYLMEYSTRINPTNWSFLAAWDSNPGTYVDSAGTNSPIRLYRVRNRNYTSSNSTGSSPAPALGDITTLIGKKVVLTNANGTEFMNFHSATWVIDEIPGLGPGTYTYSGSAQARFGSLSITWENGDGYNLYLTFGPNNSTTSGTWSGNEFYDGVNHPLKGIFSIAPIY